MWLGKGNHKKCERRGHCTVAEINRPTRQPRIMPAFLKGSENGMQNSRDKRQYQRKLVTCLSAFK
jgi:hypothetical protein